MINPNNFSKTELLVIDQDGVRHNCRRYTWESKDKLTDIDILESGDIVFKENCQLVACNERHKKIASHFNLNIQEGHL